MTWNRLPPLCLLPFECAPSQYLFFCGKQGFALMSFRVAFVLAGAISVMGMPASANQMFRAGGSSGTACPSGSQYKGSGFCKANTPGDQFFSAGGSSGTACPSGSQYKGSGFCKANSPGDQFFPAGGSSRTSCPGGSQYKGSGFCMAK